MEFLTLLDAYHMEGVSQIGAQKYFISTSPFELKSSQLNSRGIPENCLDRREIKNFVSGLSFPLFSWTTK